MTAFFTDGSPKVKHTSFTWIGEIKIRCNDFLIKYTNTANHNLIQA
jgi:hypothetical protein